MSPKAFLGVLLCLAFSSSRGFGETSTNFTAASGGNWSFGGNWSGGVTPANDASNTFIVSIPNSRTVNFDQTANTSISALSLGGTDSTLNLTAGTSLTVFGDFNPNGGLINVQSGFFNAATSKLPSGLSGSYWVSGGSTAQFNVSNYSTGFRYDASRLFMSADGANSKLTLSGMTSIDFSSMYGDGIRDFSIECQITLK